MKPTQANEFLLTSASQTRPPAI